MAVKLPALRFEAEAFQLGPQKILGRQSAGEGFLRAALSLPNLAEIHGHGLNAASAQAFAKVVHDAAPGVTPNWVPFDSPAALRETGGAHFPDPMLADPSRSRLPHGANAWSLSGITHTISSLGVMREIASYPAAPLMEWDGLICTSDAVKASVLAIIEEQEDFLAWRMPGSKAPPRLQLPVIPLGVHCADFDRREAFRAEARRALGLGAGDVAFLFAGRLSFHAKAHPYPMYAALEEAVRRAGKRIALIQCGWFANDSIAAAFKQGAQAYAPSVRHIFLDGRKADERARAWAAGDVFISLSDNIQETFGLTPLEAMAAGLPVIVTDWDGYRQTVQHDVCGYMIPTYAPVAGSGDGYAAGHASGQSSYDAYLHDTSRHVSLDLAALFDAVSALAQDADRRRRFGEAGRRIARGQFDWAVIMQRYLAFWEELGRIRTSLKPDDPRSRPRASADRLDPYRLFANYPARHVGAQTVLRLRAGGGDFRRLLADPLFSAGRENLPSDDMFDALIARFARGLAVGEAASSAGLEGSAGILVSTLLLKLGILECAAEPVPEIGAGSTTLHPVNLPETS